MRFPLRKSKYKNKRTPKSFDGIGWDSQAERDYYYQVLKIWESAGIVSKIECHKSVQLTKFVKWKVDFTYFREDIQQQVWTEFKGVETKDYKLKKDLWKEFGPGELRIVKGKSGCFHVVEVILPIGLQK